MTLASKKITVGFIVYGELTAKYLPFFLPSLKQQTYKDFSIVCIDNSPDQHNLNSQYIESNHQDVGLSWAGKNLGFGVAYNLMIRKAIEAGSEYFFIINPDTILEPDALNKLAEALDNNHDLGVVCPKLLRWDFVNKVKTKIIDSCGLVLLPGLQFIDSAQGRIDKGQFNQAAIIAPSGASGLYRISILEKIKEGSQYFDEHFFMYKEDCDLAYRLHLAGVKSKLIDDAIVYHDRTASSTGDGLLAKLENRKNKSQQTNRWSFLHQHFIYYKYCRKLNFTEKLAILKYEFKAMLLLIFFERYLFSEVIKYFKLRKTLKRY